MSRNIVSLNRNITMIFQTYLLKCTYPVIIQCAKVHHRKPFWLPVAKSKIYRVPKRPAVPKEEIEELKRLNNNYKTHMRALLNYFKLEREREEASLMSETSEISLKVEAEEWERCVKINEDWNNKIAMEREERRKLEIEAMEQYTLSRMEEMDKKLQEKIAKASEEIRKEKELSSTFITVDNLEEAVDKALNNIVDYNFAIDLKGNIYHGRDTPLQNAEKDLETGSEEFVDTTKDITSSIIPPT